MKRFLVGLVVIAVCALGIGFAYPPARPGLQASLEAIGLGAAGQRLFGGSERAASAGATPAAAPADTAPLPPAVTVVRAATREFKDQLFVSGTLIAREEAMVGAQIDGLRIVEVLADDGDTVSAGQVIARLDRSQLDALLAQNDAALVRADASIAQAQNQIAQFEATSGQAAADLARGRKLEQGILSQATLDQRLAVARAAEAQLAAARNALAVSRADRKSQDAQRRELEVRIARTEVRAPVAGVISRRSARLGALAMGGGDPLFRIIAGGEIDLDAEAPDDVLARVRVGMPAAIMLQGSAKPIAGTVRLIASEVDRTTRLGRVRIALPDGAQARIGSFASAVVELARRNGVAVPASAVASGDEGRAVQVVADGKVAVRPVEIGLIDHEAVELTRGVAAGEIVVARAAAFLRSGDAVRTMPATKEAQR